MLAVYRGQRQPYVHRSPHLGLHERIAVWLHGLTDHILHVGTDGGQDKVVAAKPNSLGVVSEIGEVACILL